MKTTLEKWFPWQQVKVYPKNFNFEMISIKIGKKSQSFNKITFVAPELLRKNIGGRWQTPPGLIGLMYDGKSSANFFCNSSSSNIKGVG